MKHAWEKRNDNNYLLELERDPKTQVYELYCLRGFDGKWYGCWKFVVDNRIILTGQTTKFYKTLRAAQSNCLIDAYKCVAQSANKICDLEQKLWVL